MFKADSLDDLTIEQYTMLVELYNKKAESTEDKKRNKYTTSIVSVEGKQGVDYGED